MINENKIIIIIVIVIYQKIKESNVKKPQQWRHCPARK